jgi:hypothetical protein
MAIAQQLQEIIVRVTQEFKRGKPNGFRIGLGSNLWPKHLRDFRIARLLGKQLEGHPLRVARFTKSREALEEACNPFDVASPYGVRKVVQLNRQKSTQLTQVFDRPPRRRRTEFMVSCVDFRAMFH